MPVLSLTNYTPKITGSAYTNDAWVIPEMLPEFTDKSTPGNFIARGSFPVFNQQCSIHYYPIEKTHNHQHYV